MPKLSESARLSSSAPKRDCALSSRAMRPSIPSSTPARMIANSAFSQSPTIAKRMPVRPEHSAAAVIALGSTARSVSPRAGRAGGSSCSSSLALGPSHAARRQRQFVVGPAHWLTPSISCCVPEFGQDRLAGDDRLPEQHFRIGPCGQVDVDPAAEADQPDPLAGRDDVARLDERHDPPRHQPGDLGEADRPPVGPLDQDMLALVLLARLVEVGVEELAGDVDHPPHRPADRRAIDVHVEHRHEDRDARDRLGAAGPAWPLPSGPCSSSGGGDLADQRDQPVGGRDDQVVALRHHALGIAEEGEHAERQERQRPGRASPRPENAKTSAMPAAISPNLRPSGWIAGQDHWASPRPRLSRNSPAIRRHLGNCPTRDKENTGQAKR